MYLDFWYTLYLCAVESTIDLEVTHTRDFLFFLLLTVLFLLWKILKRAINLYRSAL